MASRLKGGATMTSQAAGKVRLRGREPVGVLVLVFAAFLLNIAFSLIFTIEVRNHFDTIRIAETQAAARNAAEQADQRSVARACQIMAALRVIPPPPASATRPGQQYDRELYAVWNKRYQELGCQGGR